MAAGPLLLKLDQAWHGTARVLGPMVLSVAAGETVAITGPSGLGKTTLLRIIAGLHPAYEGELTGVVPARLAMVFQEPTLLPWRTVLQNITLPSGCDNSSARALLAAVGLEGREEDWPLALSLGQQRRLSLARAFALKPDLLLMDEPFASLDRDTADGIMTEFELLRSSHPVTTLLVTHAAEEAQRLATRVLRLEGQPARLTA